MSTTSFATADQVSGWLGYQLSDGQVGQAGLVLGLVASEIREVAGKPADWDPDPVPSLFVRLSIEKAVRVVTNPEGIAASSEQLGSMQRSLTFPRSGDGTGMLTADEKRAVKAAAGGQRYGSIGLVSPFSGDQGDPRDTLWPLDDVWP